MPRVDSGSFARSAKEKMSSLPPCHCGPWKDSRGDSAKSTLTAEVRVKRYDIEIGCGVGDPYCECIENGSGDWVRVEEATARIAELEAQRDEARHLVKIVVLAASEEWVATDLLHLSKEICLAIDNCKDAVKRWGVRGEG
jgi:hypothetical protein